MLGVVMLSVVAPKINLNFNYNSPKSRSSMAALAPSTRIDFPSWKQYYKTIIFVIANNGLYYKNITIVNDTSRVIRMMIASDTTTWSITYGHH
jgi:hypothetical protein